MKKRASNRGGSCRSGLGLVVFLASISLVPLAVAAPLVTDADYARAEKVLDYHLARSVHNAIVTPHWIGAGSRFWYRRQTAQGSEFIVVEAAAARRHEAFDHARLAGAIARVAPQSEINAQDLPVTDLEQDGAAVKVRLRLSKELTVSCTTRSYLCQVDQVSKPQRDDVLQAPSGSRGVFARNNNLWIVDSATGQEVQLSHDGEPYFSYGKLPDASEASLPQLRHHLPAPPFGVAWSADGRLLVGSRTDERAVSSYPYVEWVPQDGSFRPVSYSLRLALLGDSNEPRVEAFVIDAASGHKQAVLLPPGALLAGGPELTPAGDRAFVLVSSFGMQAMSLIELDLRTGAQRTLVEESSPTAVWPNTLLDSNSNMRFLAAGEEIVWFSQRDGWGHLYLYDLRTGRLKHRITSGAWLVRDIVYIDEHQRQVYFTATGREAGRDLYYRHLYRTSLDGGNVVLLTPENAEHDVEPPGSLDVGTFPGTDAREMPFSPDGRYFIDTYSTVATPPVNVLRSATDGKVMMQLERGDATATFASGWRAPQRFVARAADGQTDLYGVLYLPPDFKADHRYPLIDAFYGGPQELNAPRDFAEATATSNPPSRSSLAQLGFMVVTIDARGTPGRSRAFHDVGFGNFADPQIEDHIAVIRQLATRYPNIDLDRIGVYGHSFGGYTSARAILSHPEFFKVAVSSAGSQTYEGMYVGLEAVLGIPDYGGSRFRPTPQAIPANYAKLDNSPLAGRLRGHLMLAYGDMDENAMPSVTAQLVDALAKANKSFDLVYLPNRDHSFFRFDAYYTRRMWDYFVAHLLGAQPPENYQLRPLSREQCTDQANILAAWHSMCHY